MKQFLAFRLDTLNQCLWRGNVGDDSEQRILLTPKAFSVLRYLVDHADRLVTHDELLNAVWPDTYVQPEVLKYQVADIRSALGDNAKDPSYIETLPRRGYRFVAPVIETPIRGIRSTEHGSWLEGRDAPLHELQSCFERMLEDKRQIVFIRGETGTGKTALVDEFALRSASRVKNIRIARAQCMEGYGAREPYYVMLTALGQLCSAPGGDLVFRLLLERAPTWAAQFPALLTAENREKLARELFISSNERMVREICEAIEVITAEFPLLLVLEDLQWIDPASIDLISALARGRAKARLMLIATKRPLESELAAHPLRVLRQELTSHDLSREIALEPDYTKAQIVAEITDLQTALMKVPRSFVRVIFLSYPRGSGCAAGEQAPAAAVDCTLCEGHTAEEKAELLVQLWALFQRHTKIATERLAISLREIPATHAMEIGQIMQPVGAIAHNARV